MARNAQLERELIMTGECDAGAYDSSGEGRRFAQIEEDLRAIQRDLATLKRAAAFNPKAPLGAAA